MSGREDGGPAFPLVLPATEYNGMSLRDYFAGQVIGRLGRFSGDFRGINPDRIARGAYEIADAMLTVRQLGHSTGTTPGGAL